MGIYFNALIKELYIKEIMLKVEFFISGRKHPPRGTIGPRFRGIMVCGYTYFATTI